MSSSVPGQVPPTESDPPFISCESPEQRIAVRVVAREVETGGQKKRFWMIEALPESSDILIDDAFLKEQLQRMIARLMPAEGNFKVKAGASGSPEDFHRRLMVFNPDIVDYDLDVEAPENLGERLPTAEEAAANLRKTVVLCVSYAPQSPPAARPATLKVLLSTTKDQSIPVPLTKTGKLLELDPDLSGKPAGESRVEFAFYPRDLDDARGDGAVTDPRARVEEELSKVAQKAVQAAKPVIVSNGEIVPCSESKREDLAAAVRAALLVYKLPGEMKWNEITVKPRCENLDSRDEWTILVEGLRLVRSVAIEVAAEDWEKTQTGAAAIKLENKRRRRERELKQKFGTALSAKAGRIPTAEQVAGDSSPETSPFREEVKTILAPTSESSVTATAAADAVVFYPVFRKTREIELVLGAKAGYSEESKLTGRLEAGLVNLFNFGESISLSAEAGNEVQKYLFSLTKSFEDENARTPRFELKELSVQVQVFKDKDVRLSNLTTDEIALREAGSTARLSFGYDSLTADDREKSDCLASPERKKNHYGVLMDLSALYRDVNIKNDDVLLTVTGIDPRLLPAARTQNTKFAFGVDGFYARDFRRPSKAGLGFFRSSVRSVFEKGTRAFGADYSYSKIGTLMQAELLFGWQTPTDMFIGFRQRIDRGSGGTPVFELPRLGGPDSVRGIEEGERIGRSVYSGQLDVGLNSLTLFRMLRGKNNVRGGEEFCPGVAPAAESGVKTYLSKIYLKAFYDFGRVRDETSYTTNPNFRQTVKGYGIAVELRRLARDQRGNYINFSFGYARSPESVLHRRGVFFAGVGYEF